MIVYPIVVAVMVLVATVLYWAYLWFPVDQKLDAYVERQDVGRYEEQVVDLGSIPKVQIVDGNFENFDCDQPKFLGVEPKDYTSQCFNVCGGNGSVRLITDDDQIFVDGKQLRPGYWCFKQRLVDCNPKFGRLLASPNGVVCRPKFPNLVGGASANQVVACQHEGYREAGYLIDKLDPDLKFNLRTVKFSSEDERMPDGSFRFECRYPNIVQRLIDHPFNRLTPLADPCVAQYSAEGDQFDPANDTCKCNGRTTKSRCHRCPEVRISCLRDRSLFSDELQPCPDRSLLSTECTGLDQATNTKRAPLGLAVLEPQTLFTAYEKLATPRPKGTSGPY